MKNTIPKSEKLKEVDGKYIHESPNKLHQKALRALELAKELESITPTKKIISKDGKIVRFVKIKSNEKNN
ncbi:MAG: hypothetical protein JXR64_02825 [Spirochaetales bacterium]|nr:hypothetical protein [Spirochaetales bacterium]